MDAQLQFQEGVLAVAGTLDLDAAEALRDALLHLLENAANPKLDLTGVAVCDLAGLQLIFSALRTATRQGTPITVTGLGPAIPLACRQHGSSSEELLEGAR